MSRKVFAASEVLAAADLNTFLMDQSVMAFASESARNTAIPFPVEGMVVYLEDTNNIRIYDGSSWVPLPVGSGGTGATTLASGGYLKGAGTSAITSQSGIPAGDITSGTLPVGRGGTGATTLSSGGYLKGSGTSAITSQSGIPATDITSGILPIARGGTGVATGGGLVRLADQSFSAQTSVAVDNVFTSTYLNYKVFLRVDSTSAGNNTVVNMQLRKGGSDNAQAFRGGSQFVQSIGSPTTGIFDNGVNTATPRVLNTGIPSTPSTVSMEVFSPNAVANTNVLYQSVNAYGAATVAGGNLASVTGSYMHLTADNMDGIRFFPASGNFTGRFIIYGYGNS